MNLKSIEFFTSELFKWNDCNIKNQQKLINTFQKYGCIIIPNMLSTKDCDSIIKIISKEERNKNNETGLIHSNYKRKDLMIPLSKSEIYIRNIYNKINFFCDKIVPKPRVVESSSLISYPGSFPQIWHTDTHHTSKDEGNLVSFGIALDNITDDMGPLEVYLGSNKMYNQDKYSLMEKNNVKEDNLENMFDDGSKYQSLEELCRKLNYKKQKCICTKGSLVIWYSKVVHRGGANKNKKRPVFYFSLLGTGTTPEGATYSLKRKNNSFYL
jgi:ectoine hydroxylase-related dioxygenase (phytanoyl-CoA dioxygenase family)